MIDPFKWYQNNGLVRSKKWGRFEKIGKIWAGFIKLTLTDPQELQETAEQKAYIETDAENLWLVFLLLTQKQFMKL